MGGIRLVNIAVFASGGGSNLRAIYESITDGTLQGVRLTLIVSNNSKSGAIEFATNAGVPTAHLSLVACNNDAALLEKKLMKALSEAQTDLIVLAGYMKKLPEAITHAYEKRIINIHPALLPKFGGEGMFGLHVHRAVIESGEKESGATIHYVTSEYDKGEIILQEKCEVYPDDTAERLQARIKEIEHRMYPKVLDMLRK